LPSCNAISCGSFPTPIPFVGSFICSGTKFNDFCSVSCPLGYIATGDRILRCQENGTWNHANASCVPVECPPFMHFATNASVKCSRELAVYSQCTVTCNPGFVPSTRTSFGTGTSYTRVCESSGEWSSEDLHCVPVNCQLPNSKLILPGGRVASSGSGYGHVSLSISL
jgi:CUB/sushi domain-containing protein